MILNQPGSRMLPRIELYKSANKNFGTKPFALTAQSGLAYIRIDGSNAANIYYILSRVVSATTTGLRWFFTDNTTQPLISLGFDSTGTAGAPNVTNTTITHKYGKWFAVAYSHDGSLTAANIKMYSNSTGGGNGGYDQPLNVVANSTTSNGTTAFSNDAANNYVIGDRQGGARNFNGAIGYVAQWNRVLSQAELDYARSAGPLNVQNGLVMCWAGGHDYGPYGSVPTDTATTWADNPGFVVLQNRQRRYMVGKPAAGFIGTPGAGSLVKTGQTATLVKPFADSPGAGSIVKTGSVPSLVKNFVFNPIAGSLTKTGSAPTLVRPFADSPAAGSLVKTGAIPTLTIPTGSFTGTPIAGALTKQGFSPDITLPTARRGGGYPYEDRKRRKKGESREQYLRLPDGQIVPASEPEGMAPEAFAKALRARMDQQTAADDEDLSGALFYMMASRDYR